MLRAKTQELEKARHKSNKSKGTRLMLATS
jgi:hypothetical protein